MLTLSIVYSQKTIHVYVALCDNANQGIIPVPSSLGNGQDPGNNLYWGAAYGVKSFFHYKSSAWAKIEVVSSECKEILDRVLFYNSKENAYLLAEAYDGKHIKACISDYVLASNGQNGFDMNVKGTSLSFGGSSDLLAYCGHNGLMEFSLEAELHTTESSLPTITLACASQYYFEPYFKQSGATPLLWTTNLMAPEAYTLEAAIDGWLQEEEGPAIKERAAQAYHKYQKCGINGSRNLFATGFGE